ncbi:MAG: S9 family peptidase [Saprospiraceae bacterium]|nr:S9 family peptidase [Saprospiraceae bacterium]
MIKRNIHPSLFIIIMVLFGFLFRCELQAKANQLLKMTPNVYNEWAKIKNVNVSDSAATIMYTLEKETGDKKLCVYRKADGKTFIFDRVVKAELDRSGRYVVFTHGLSFDSLRILKRKKTAKDKLPADSLSVFDIFTNKTVVVDDVTDFSLPTKFSGYCVYTKSIKKVAKDSVKVDKEKPYSCKDVTIIVRNLFTTGEDTLQHIKDYTLCEETPLLAFSQCTGDSIGKYKVFMFDLASRKIKTISKAFEQTAQLSFDKKGNKFAFLGLAEKSFATKKPFDLYLLTSTDSIAKKIAGQESTFKPSDWVISEHRKPAFSEAGSRLFFGTSPQGLKKDTTLLDDEIVQVEIWHHDTPRLYTQMESTIEEDKKISYQAIYDIATTSMVQLETEEFDRSVVSVKGDGRYALQIRTLPYRKSVSWLGEVNKDIFLYDLWNKTAIPIAQGQSDAPLFSPMGKYVYWYNKPDSLWQYYDISRMKLGVFGDIKLTAFYDEENDVPQFPDHHGVAGWLKDDQAILIYDKYDIWQISPDDPLSNIALTDGRLSKLRYRYVKLNQELEYIDPSSAMMMHVFNEKTKGESYASLHMKTGKVDVLVSGDFSLSKNVTLANKSEYIIFTKQSFDIFPDLLLADTSLTYFRKISDANSQQSNYAWGSNKLFKWNDYKGKEIHGMLFFPPGFDSNKKYPLIVNFYERSSDELNRHRAPEAHRSSINYTYYTNLGYVIFNPDIPYTKGQPGEDCYNAVNSGVDALVKEGYIDSMHMGLQGHSWGGYQIAYLLTRTGRFACAEAGAPVVNMVSAYGGIRWESGMSRMFQYEKAQSRLGSTLWDDTELFHKNSPIYNMTKVSTPVLIMHNDEDGAVPWEQGIEYFMALRRLGKAAWLLNYSGEPHWPVKWQNRLDFNIRLEQFFNYCLMGATMPLWMKEGNTPLEKGILNKY